MLRKRIQRLAATLLAAIVAASVSGCISADNTVSLPAADLAGPRLLVIAPHPDDETVGAGGAIATARERGWNVTVVFVTSGDVRPLTCS
jgi:GlcNAc-PI de-N-acetylase